MVPASAASDLTGPFIGDTVVCSGAAEFLFTSPLVITPSVPRSAAPCIVCWVSINSAHVGVWNASGRMVSSVLRSRSLCFAASRTFALIPSCRISSCRMSLTFSAACFGVVFFVMLPAACMTAEVSAPTRKLSPASESTCRKFRSSSFKSRSASTLLPNSEANSSNPSPRESAIVRSAFCAPSFCVTRRTRLCSASSAAPLPNTPATPSNIFSVSTSSAPFATP